MAEITVSVADKGTFYPLLRPTETYFFLYAAREVIFVKMWPSNEFEFETTVVKHDTF